MERNRRVRGGSGETQRESRVVCGLRCSDGAVKVWDIPMITGTAESSVQSFVILWKRKENEAMGYKEVRSSKSECIRALCISEDAKHIIMARNWLYIWSIDPNSGLFLLFFLWLNISLFPRWHSVKMGKWT